MQHVNTVLISELYPQEPAELAALGQQADWSTPDKGAGLAAVDVSENQPPRDSSFHSLRICLANPTSPQFLIIRQSTSFFFFYSYYMRKVLTWVCSPHVDEPFSVEFLFCTTCVSCVFPSVRLELLHHGFGLDCGLRCERPRLVCFSGAAQRLLEQHEPKVNIFVCLFVFLHSCCSSHLSTLVHESMQGKKTDSFSHLNTCTSVLPLFKRIWILVTPAYSTGWLWWGLWVKQLLLSW